MEPEVLIALVKPNPPDLRPRQPQHPAKLVEKRPMRPLKHQKPAISRAHTLIPQRPRQTNKAPASYAPLVRRIGVYVTGLTQR